MPYGISESQVDCAKWATVKQIASGSYVTLACHDTKQAALDQMVAVSMSEKVEPIGDVTVRSRDTEVVLVDLDETLVTKSRYPMRDAVDAINQLAHDVFIVTGREEAQREQTLDDLQSAGIRYSELFMMPDISMNIAQYKRDTVERLMDEYEVIAFVDDNDENRAAVESLGVYVMTPDEFVDAAFESGLFDIDVEMLETREVNRVAPGFMAASARRGLRLHAEGYSGDGLMPATVTDARRMAEGVALSADKWRRIPGWIARHLMDLDAVDGDEITPGLVAMLLWGGGSSKSSARRAQAYAERIVAQLDDDEQRDQPRDPDGKFASTGGGASSGDDGGTTQKPVATKLDVMDANQAAIAKLAPSTKPVTPETLKMTKDKNLTDIAEKGQRGTIANWQVTDSEGNHVGSIKQVREKAPRYAPNPDATVTTFYAKPRAKITAKPKNTQEIDLFIGLQGSVGSSSKEVALKTLTNRHNRILEINAAAATDGRSALDDDEQREQPRKPNGQFGSTGGTSTTGDTGGDAPGGGATTNIGGTEAEYESTITTLQNDQADYIENLPGEQLESVVEYTSSAHYDINKTMRGAPPPPIENQDIIDSAERHAGLVNNAIHDAPSLSNDITVYRGVDAGVLGIKAENPDFEFLSPKLAGAVFTDGGIISTSISSSEAKRFDPNGVVLAVRVPKGSKALYVDDISTHPGERELLLPMDTKFTILDVQRPVTGKLKGMTVLSVEANTPKTNIYERLGL